MKKKDTNKANEEIARLTKEVMALCDGMPTGQWLKVYNRLRKIRLATHGVIIPDKPEPETEPLPASTSKQIADRYVAVSALLDAMVAGEHVTMQDAHRFKVCDMHTAIARVKDRIKARNLPYAVESRRITFGADKKICKEYWLIHTTNNN